MVTVLGLAFDLVGAVALALGLFEYSRPEGWHGLQRSPGQYAHDAAFGVVGGTLLSVGFLLEALPYMGISHYSRHWVTALFALVALIVVAAAAFVAYGLLFIAFHAVEARRLTAEHPSIGYDVRRTRSGVRFWLQEPVPLSEAPTEPGTAKPKT